MDGIEKGMRQLFDDFAKLCAIGFAWWGYGLMWFFVVMVMLKRGGTQPLTWQHIYADVMALIGFICLVEAGRGLVRVLHTSMHHAGDPTHG